MGVFHKIKKLLDINKMSISKLSKLSGVPVSTIYSLKKRDSKRINIDTLKRIADVLGVNINYFSGSEQCGAINLTEEEEEMILKIRSLDEHGAKIVKTVLDIEFERIDNKVDIVVKVDTDSGNEEKDISVDICRLADSLEELE